ncbi:acyltransferase family protein [Flavobacterium sp. 120]|uniref:acyltransferase family protein n=1 Tax=Flavobacterium sp. 120 TaxID=2135626 RepID=UPI000EAE5B4C|nr:acyltransferase family protein [Flavobacterium sp. 120]RKS13312.1 surface polysaccharide O-acyltransferase-like enzyme [Flavobacterium sp. 120]
MSRIAIKERNSNIDLVKFICAFGVICIHTNSSTANAALIVEFFLPLCVPFFLLSALVFFIVGLKKPDLYSLANKISTRIIIPYFFWTAIYFLLIVMKHLAKNESYSNDWWKILFFGESAVQLYYIPKMLIMEGIALSVVLLLNQNNKRRYTGAILFLFSSAWLLLGIKNKCFSFSEADFAMTALYLVLAFAISKIYEHNEHKNIFIILGFLLLLSLFLFKYLHFDNNNGLLFNTNGLMSIIGGLSLTLLAFTLPSLNFPKRIEIIFGFSYGIYLSHILFLEAFEFILNHFRINLFYDFWTKLIFSICVLVSSILFVFLVKKVSILKRVLLGE